MSAGPVGISAAVREVLRSRSGLAGVIILVAMILLSAEVWVSRTQDVVNRWNDPQAWLFSPRLAAPEWTSYLTQSNPSRTIILDPEDFRQSRQTFEGLNYTRVQLRGRIFYDYDTPPSEILLNTVIAGRSRALLTVTWVKPDGTAITIIRQVADPGSRLIFLQNEGQVAESLAAHLNALGVERKFSIPQVLFYSNSTLESGGGKVLKSSDMRPDRPYEIILEILGQEPDITASAKLGLLGEVHGLAGTDNIRRDVFLGIVWGAPVALTFGLVAAIVVTLVQALFGAVSGYYGRKVDEILQRLTDIYLVLPFLSLLITIQFIYKTSIWTLLAAVVFLSLFGGVTKSVRSMVLQIREEPYIEAATSYGAGRARILFLYIMPRVLPYTFANITVSVPAFVFLEAGLSLLGLGDPELPTWGKLISDAYAGGAAYFGYWWWILIPAAFIIMVSLAFALIWYALDKVLNPRLREE